MKGGYGGKEIPKFDIVKEMPVNNDPTRTVEEKMIYNKMKDTFEGSIDYNKPDPNLPKKTVELTVYDRPQQQQPPFKKQQDFNYRDYIAPRIPVIGNAPPQFFPQYYGVGGPLAEFESPPVINQYTISMGGPKEAAFISNIYEDVMPTSVMDLSNVSSIAARKMNNEYIRSSLFPVGNSQEISFDTKDKNCLLSYTKLVKLAPYSSNLSNPFKTMPKDTLIYHTAYPIIKDGLNIKIPKDCTLLNLIITKIGKDATGKSVLSEEQMKELEYYNKIGRIVNNKVCPNFTTMYGYYFNNSCDIDFDAMKSSSFNMTKIISKSNKADSCLVLLTEGATTNLQNWRTKKFVIDGNARKTSSTGHKPHDVWESVLYQIIAAIYTMQRNNIYIHNFGIDNIYIKEVLYGSNKSEVWKYEIDGFEYFVPNMDYLVLLDLNRTNLTMQEVYLDEIKDEHKGDFKPECIDGVGKILMKCGGHKMLLNVLEQIKNTKGDEKRVIIMPDETTNLIDRIIAKLDEIDPLDISIILYEFFNKYLNNRIGTVLSEQEIKYVDNKSGIEFERGSICVIKESHDIHRFVLYVGEKDAIKCNIITRDDRNKLELQEINKDELYKYLIKIQQTDIQTTRGIFNYNNIIETYTIQQII